LLSIVSFVYLLIVPSLFSPTCSLSCFVLIRRPSPVSTLFPYTTLFRSATALGQRAAAFRQRRLRTVRGNGATRHRTEEDAGHGSSEHPAAVHRPAAARRSRRLRQPLHRHPAPGCPGHTGCALRELLRPVASMRAIACEFDD